MAQRTIEFHCSGGCGWWNYPVLRDNMNGNFTYVCGNCGHEHYRVIKDGVITEDRHSTKHGEAERVIVTKAACQEKKREHSPVQKLRQLEAAGLAK